MNTCEYCHTEGGHRDMVHVAARAGKSKFLVLVHRSCLRKRRARLLLAVIAAIVLAVAAFGLNASG